MKQSLFINIIKGEEYWEMPTFNDSVKQIGKSDATSKTTVSLVNVRAKFYNEIDISNEVYT